MNLDELFVWMRDLGVPAGDQPRFLLAAGALAALGDRSVEPEALFRRVTGPLDYELAPLRRWIDPRAAHVAAFPNDLAQLIQFDDSEFPVRVAFAPEVASEVLDYLRVQLHTPGIPAFSWARGRSVPTRPWDWPLRLAVPEAFRDQVMEAHHWSRDLIIPVDPFQRMAAPQMIVGPRQWIDEWADAGITRAGCAVVVDEPAPLVDGTGMEELPGADRATAWVFVPNAQDLVAITSDIVYWLSHNHSLDEAVAHASNASAEVSLIAPPEYLDRTRIIETIARTADHAAATHAREVAAALPPPPPPPLPAPRPPVRGVTIDATDVEFETDPDGPHPQMIEPPQAAPPDPDPAPDPAPEPSGAEPGEKADEAAFQDEEEEEEEAGEEEEEEEENGGGFDLAAPPTIADFFHNRPFDSEIHDATEAVHALGDERSKLVDREHRFLTADATPGPGVGPSAYRTLLEVWIAPLRLAGSAVAPERFRDETLPWAGMDLPLDVVLFELKDRGLAQRRRIELPPAGASSKATFELDWTDGDFDGRIVVLHEHRFVQSMLITVDAGNTTVRFETECVVRPADFDLMDVVPHQASIVLNDHNGPLVAVSTSAGEEIRAPQGLDELRKSMTGLLRQVIDEPDDFTSISSAPFQTLLVDMAQRGVTLREVLFTGQATAVAAPIYEALRTSKRISILSAVPTHVLPLEFVYEPAFEPTFGSPGTVCDTAVTALAAGKSLAELEDGCAHVGSGGTCGADKAKMCPLGFWGFRKVIERHTNRDASAEVKKDYALSASPAPGRSTVDIGNVLAAATPKADANPAEAWGAARAALQTALPDHFSVALDWKEIVDDYNDDATRHGLLVLVPHVDKDNNGQLQLDLGAEPHMPVHQITSALKLGKDKAVVLLLGCSTGAGESPTEEFPGRFMDAGASVVLATMTLVRGRFVAGIAQRVVESLLAKIASDGQAGVGDALLQVRQELLAVNPLVMSLVAYGDADWSLVVTPD